MCNKKTTTHLCPKCGQPLETSGIMSVGKAELTVYQCDQCVVPLKFGDFTIDGAATFYYDPVAGRLVDGGTGNAFQKDN